MRIPQLTLLWIGPMLAMAAIASAQGVAPVVEPPKAQAQAQVPDGPTVPASKAYIDLIHRYKFSEQYSVRESPAEHYVICQYLVTVDEKLKDSIDVGDATDGAANKPTEQSRQIVYLERPAEVSGLGQATATVRKYRTYRSASEDTAKGVIFTPLQGLNVWCRPQQNLLPLVFSLDPRPLREREFELAAHQLYLPSLSALLPTIPVRVGDTWRISRKAVQSLLGEPELRGDSINGKFVEIRREEKGQARQAVIAINGRIENQVAQTLVNAQLVFRFLEPSARPERPESGIAPPARPSDDSLVDARGSIIELRMARVANGVIPGPSKKPQKFQARQDLILERGPDPRAGEGLLPIPTTAPKATESNSWLIYKDPKNRFVFEHPQDLLPPERKQHDADDSTAVYLVKTRPEGRDLLSLYVFQQVKGPEALKDLLNVQWKRAGGEILNGEEKWLEAGDWGGKKVFRLEAAMVIPGRGARAPRIHYDAYLVQIGNDASVMAIATTTREAIPAFRSDVEKILKKFKIGSDQAY
jgi:hypothetical protein